VITEHCTGRTVRVVLVDWPDYGAVFVSVAGQRGTIPAGYLLGSAGVQIPVILITPRRAWSGSGRAREQLPRLRARVGA